MKHLITILHCNIYLASYPKKMFEQHDIDENVKTTASLCNSWSHQCSKSLEVRVALYSPQYDELYDIYAFMLKRLVFFNSHGHSTPMSHKGSKYRPWQHIQ